MIIQNGTMEVMTSNLSERNPNTGYYIEPIAQWATPIPCQIVTINQNLQARTSNKEHFTSCDYMVLIEKQEISGEQILLRHLDGTEIGEYSIKSLEALDAVNQIKIIV